MLKTRFRKALAAVALPVFVLYGVGLGEQVGGSEATDAGAESVQPEAQPSQEPANGYDVYELMPGDYINLGLQNGEGDPLFYRPPGGRDGGVPADRYVSLEGEIVYLNIQSMSSMTGSCVLVTDFLKAADKALYVDLMAMEKAYRGALSIVNEDIERTTDHFQHAQFYDRTSIHSVSAFFDAGVKPLAPFSPGHIDNFMAGLEEVSIYLGGMADRQSDDGQAEAYIRLSDQLSGFRSILRYYDRVLTYLGSFSGTLYMEDKVPEVKRLVNDIWRNLDSAQFSQEQCVRAKIVGGTMAGIRIPPAAAPS